MLRRLPVEIWLLVIDELGAAREYDALEACAEASAGLLKETAEKYIPNEMTLRTREEILSINLKQRWQGPRKVRIERGLRDDLLTIERAEWRVDDFHLRSLSLNLGCFPITNLKLYDVTFPSIPTFWRVVCVFPELSALYLDGVKIVETAVDARTLSALRLLRAPRLQWIEPDRHSHPATDLAGLLHVFLAQTVPSPKALPWRHVGHLRLSDVTLPTAAAFGRLLGAFPGLKELIINGPCTFAAHGLNPGHAPRRPHMPLVSGILELGKDFSLCSDPQSVRDLVDLLIQSGVSRRLGRIIVWLSLSMRVATNIDLSLNRLVKDAGKSLKYLSLRVLPQDSLPLFNGASTLSTGARPCCFDISADTRLSHLACSVNITHEDGSWIALLLELLRQVTSKPEDFGYLEVAFNVMDDADLTKVWPGLPFLNAALSETTFDKYGLVAILFPNANKSIDSLRAKAMVESCLPKLAAWNVL
ncbi:hypothetical protein IEO21_09188 [Rhodonia placenta]|uniref:F-box domain-containing protein n=1 Tax=Rhodonia placenta TaxID=104341 RepID=A0A8H7TYH0_9APHY|nr:hypothetical protein IEO21_09188 [Postia placenta]